MRTRSGSGSNGDPDNDEEESPLDVDAFLESIVSSSETVQATMSAGLTNIPGTAAMSSQINPTAISGNDTMFSYDLSMQNIQVAAVGTGRSQTRSTFIGQQQNQQNMYSTPNNTIVNNNLIVGNISNRQRSTQRPQNIQQQSIHLQQQNIQYQHNSQQIQQQQQPNADLQRTNAEMSALLKMLKAGELSLSDFRARASIFVDPVILDQVMSIVISGGSSPQQYPQQNVPYQQPQGSIEFQMLQQQQQQQQKSQMMHQQMTPSKHSTKQGPSGSGQARTNQPVNGGATAAAAAAFLSQNQSQQQSQASSSKGASSSQSSMRGADVTKMDSDSLGDVIKYAGVDLKEEEDNMMRDSERLFRMDGGAVQAADKFSKFEFLTNAGLFKQRISQICRSKGLNEVLDRGVLDYLALAAMDRLRDILERLIIISRHRSDVDRDLFEWEPLNEPKKQMWLVDRNECDMNKAFAAESDTTNTIVLDSSTGEAKLRKTKKKKVEKEEEPSVKTKLANVVVANALGKPRKSWMMSGSAGRSLSQGTPNPFLTSSSSKGESSSKSTRLSRTANAQKQHQSMLKKRSITLPDLLFLMESDPVYRKTSVLYEKFMDII